MLAVTVLVVIVTSIAFFLFQGIVRPDPAPLAAQLPSKVFGSALLAGMLFSLVFFTQAHLIELDLLRAGERLTTREPLQPGDFYAFVCRKERLPKVDVYGWTLREPLPTIPVPLSGDDPDVALELQAAFTTTYDRAGYDYSLDYQARVEPPLEPGLAEWVRSLIPPRA